MPVSQYLKLKGLTAKDRTPEEKAAIEQQMGYNEPDTLAFNTPSLEAPSFDSTSAEMLNKLGLYHQHFDNEYQKALEERNDFYHTEQDVVNSNANEYLDKIANEVSSYYKKYNGTDKLPISDQEKKALAAQYDARKEVYGEDNANIWLDNQFKDIVGNNQSKWEQMIHGVSHLIPAIEGGAIQAFGNVYGAINYVLGNEPENQSPDLNWWDGMLDAAIDNSITRYGRDVEHAGASNVVQGLGNLLGLMDETAAERIAATKASATKYNPEGIGADAIVTTQEQDDSYISSATPWQALQSGGFTALSMLVGAGEAKLAGSIFGGLAKGATWLNGTGKALKSAEALEKALVGIKRAQNFTDTFIIPAAVGTMEGALEGLSTKIDVEREAVQNLDDYYREKVNKEVDAILNDPKENPFVEYPTIDGGYTLGRLLNAEEVYKQVWDKYQDEYMEARRQIDWASSKAGIHNFYANSLINGAINQTLKAGLMAPRVQETLRNSRMFGWTYGKPKFRVTNGVATPVTSKSDIVLKVLKEPLGEGLEEYGQSLSNDIFSGAAENNINEFIKNKFEGDGTATVTDSFGSDYAAALTALGNSLVNKESIQSAILGAVSSTMGTVGGISRGYHRDANGKLVQNSLFDPRNLTRGLNDRGEQESWFDYAARVTPWRSGALNAYYDARKEQADARETAANLTEWLKDPQNKAKWDGLTGTANWMTQMEEAAESNDQFSYRKAQMGKTINDVFMLQKLEGTDFYNSVLADLQKAANGQLSQEEIQKMREQGGEEYQSKSDEEIVEKVQSNANRMLGLMSQVEAESQSLDRLLGRIDEDTKQSLIFGKLMEENFRERRDQLKEEIDTITSRIESSRRASGVSLDDELKSLILEYGTINKALKAQEDLQTQKEKLEQKVKELEAIDSDKTSDKQKEDLIKSKNELKRVDRKLETFKGLYNEDGQIDSSLSQLVLNEEEIMALDPVTRAMVLAQGAKRLYNATHQDRQKVDQLNLEIDELDHQIDLLEVQNAGWMKGGKVKKGHNKQHERNTKKIAELRQQRDSKMRALDAEQGRMTNKSVYNSAQQEVVDNLVQQGIAQDNDFLDKVIDMGRLTQDIKDYHTQYQAILSDPKAFRNYVLRARYNAQRDLTRRRAERISSIQDFQEYSQELDRITANASDPELREIFQAMSAENERQKEEYRKNNMVIDENTGDWVAPTEMPQTNYDRYMENLKKQSDLVRQFVNNPELTDNDRSLLEDAMQYLFSHGVDVTDREAAVEALIERDEEGNQGGKFRQWVEAKNDALLPQQRAFMPVFTSIGQVVSQYVDLINGWQQDAINKGNIQATVVPADGAVTIIAPPVPAPSPTPTPQPEGGTLFDRVGGSTPEAGRFVDGNGTVATGAQTQAMQQRQEEKERNIEEKSARSQLFEQVTTPAIAQMVDDSSNIIETSNASDEVKALAAQYLDALAVNTDETYSTIDDIMDAIIGKINELNAKSDMEKNRDNDYSKAAALLNKVYNSLNAKKARGKGRSLRRPSGRPATPKGGILHTANIPYIQSKNPDAWAVRFTDSHHIDEWNRNHVIDTDEPIYFITDSQWTAAVTSQMNNRGNEEGKQKYDTLTNMPIVVAVQVETPQNPNNTTAIELGGLWYQPIGILPSKDSTSVDGAAWTEELRKLASKEQGRHLITEDGLPNGNPLTTRVYGKNYLEEHHPDDAVGGRQNSTESNTSVLDAIIENLPLDSRERLRGMTKQEMLDDPEFQEAASQIIDGIQWNGEDAGRYKNQITITVDNHKVGETGNPMLIFDVPMDKTEARTSDKTLPEVLAEGTNDEVVTFNSRTQRIFDEVIAPLFANTSKIGRSSDRSAAVITKADLVADPNAFQTEADRLTKMLTGYDGTAESSGIRGIGAFIFINPKTSWKLQVTAPPVSMQTVGDTVTDSESTYKIWFVNERTNERIPLGEIKANATSDRDPATLENARTFLRNFLSEGLKINASLQDQDLTFLNWQKPKNDAQNLLNPDKSQADKARRNWYSIITDGILTFAGSSLHYEVDGVKMHIPVLSDGHGNTRIAYPSTKVTNADNANTGAPQNITLQGEGAVIAGDGSQVLGDSGATVGEAPEGNPPGPQESEKLRKAKEVTRKIIADSEQFTLAKDETYYYIEDKTTGERTKYLRVTTVIGADESAPQWTPSIQDIYNKLRETHSLQELSPAQLATFKNIEQMSQDLNIPVAEIRRAVAELRTVHKHEAYGAWSTPSTSIGNTFDSITRDFLAGHLKDSYPNVTKEVLDTFVQQLTLFKNDLDSKGIHIVSEGVMAHGTITMTDADGKTHEAKVAGTLDLFGYDDEGNFYIFDMKTTRNHSIQKLEEEKAKWSRQVSMYADLLKQSYGIEIRPENLRIIPINVDYPAPEEWNRTARKMIPARDYREDKTTGQLQVSPHGKDQYTDFLMPKPGNEHENNGDNTVGMRKTSLEGQYPPGYTPFRINWDNLSSEDQDIADALVTQAGTSGTQAPATPAEAHIETPSKSGYSFVDTGDIDLSNFGIDGSTDAPAPPVIPNSQVSLLPTWENLSEEAKTFLMDKEDISTKEEYNKILNNPEEVLLLEEKLKCNELI